MKTIELTNIYKSFGTKTVLHDVSLQVEEGEILGLLGPSGAGKTTILNILTGQLMQDSGTASLLGCDSQHLQEEHYDQIGLVLDTCGIYERLSVKDNLMMFAKLHKKTIQDVRTVLKQVGLASEVKTIAGAMSKGMKQRLIFARAILHSPKVLFLDEPTSGLDPQTSKQMHRIIERMKAQGATIFLTTHNMEETTKLCDHVALLHAGGIVAYGTPKQLCLAHMDERKAIVEFQDGSTLSVNMNPSDESLISSIWTRDDLVSIHSIEPNLEDVFLSLTGRRLEG